MANAPAQAPIPPQRVMSQLLFGKQLTASLSALARLGVADHMDETAISTEDLAGKVGAHAPSLYRVMRMLASVGVFTEEPGRKFALTPVGETLKSDAQGSMRAMAMMLGDNGRCMPIRAWRIASAPESTASPWLTASRSSIFSASGLSNARPSSGR